MSNEKQTGLSRRSFLTGTLVAGALTATGALSACAPQVKGESDSTADAAPDTQATNWLGEAPQITDAECAETLDFEVLVVGAGTSGYYQSATKNY